jgi:hypothetical protein
MSDADTAPKGSVATQVSRISHTLPQLASSLRSKLMPKIPPDVTCVVDTGRANGEARVTSVVATKLAVPASRVAIGVIFLPGAPGSAFWYLGLGVAWDSVPLFSPHWTLNFELLTSNALSPVTLSAGGAPLKRKDEFGCRTLAPVPFSSPEDTKHITAGIPLTPEGTPITVSG